jgi:Spy/CpxP family protein refolding chaperone
MKIFKLATVSVLTIAGMGLTSIAIAEPRSSDGPRHFSGMSGKHFERMAERLELSTEQKAALKDSFSSQRANRQAQRKVMRAAHAQLKQLIRSGASESTVKSQADKVAALHSNQLMQKFYRRQQMSKVLSAEQLDKLDKHREQRMGHRKEGGKRKHLKHHEK